MARKPDEHMDFSVTERFTQGSVPFDALFTQWLHAEEQRRGKR